MIYDAWLLWRITVSSDAILRAVQVLIDPPALLR